MSVTYEDSHVAKALDRLVSQYQGAPRVRALVTALASRAQVIEDAIASVAQGRFLSNNSAVGPQLDAIGALVGADRNGLDDETYRVIIRGKIAINTSRGTLGDIETIAKTLFQAKAVYATTPNAPGHDRIRAYAELSLAIGSPKTPRSLEGRIIGLIRQALPAGVALASFCYFDADNAMACDGPQPWVRHLADGPNGAGGLLADAIYTNALA